MTIRVTEIFPSIQGEGHYSGVPSIFVRLYGCNMACRGFNNPSMTPILYAVPEGVTSVKELDGDAFAKGCDTPYAWHPAFKKLQKDYEPLELFHELKNRAEKTGINHIVFTGGEPLLNQVMLTKLLHLFQLTNVFDHITFETNGSIAISPPTATELVLWLEKGETRTLLFSNSPKLHHSGEEVGKRVNPRAIMAQAALRTSPTIRPGSIIQTFKYVVGPNEEDFLEAKTLHRTITMMDKKHSWEKTTYLYPAYAMPLGADAEQYHANMGAVAELCMKHKLRYCPRVHIDLYGNKVGT